MNVQVQVQGEKGFKLMEVVTSQSDTITETVKSRISNFLSIFRKQGARQMLMAAVIFLAFFLTLLICGAAESFTDSYAVTDDSDPGPPQDAAVESSYRTEQSHGIGHTEKKKNISRRYLSIAV